MTKTKNGKIFALIAAACYAVVAAYYIINYIYYAVNYGFSIGYIDVIIWAINIGSAVTLLIQKEKFVIAAAGANLLLYVYFLLAYHFSYYWYISVAIAYAALIVLLVLTIKGNTVVKKIWFIAGAVILIALLYHSIRSYIPLLPRLWPYMVRDTAEVAAVFLTGLWLKEHFAEDAPIKEYAAFDPQAVYSSADAALIGGADKLKMYKQLLDAGTITQEEFDAKKKQILGL